MIGLLTAVVTAGVSSIELFTAGFSLGMTLMAPIVTNGKARANK